MLPSRKNERFVVLISDLYFQNLITIQEYEAEGEKLTEDEEVMWYLRRLDGGLFTLQTVDYILAWIAMEDDGVSGLLTCGFCVLKACYRFGSTCFR